MPLQLERPEIEGEQRADQFRRLACRQFFQRHRQQPRHRFQRMKGLPHGEAQRLCPAGFAYLIHLQTPMPPQPVEQAFNAACFCGKEERPDPRNHPRHFNGQPAEFAFMGKTSENLQLGLQIIRCNRYINGVGGHFRFAPVRHALGLQHSGTGQRRSKGIRIRIRSADRNNPHNQGRGKKGDSSPPFFPLLSV